MELTDEREAGSFFFSDSCSTRASPSPSMSPLRTLSAEAPPHEERGRRADKDSESLKHDDLHPETQQQRRIEAQTRQAFKSEDYRQLFHLPPEEVLVQDFNCALQKKILLQGHMYLFERYVCFYSNIFGYEKKVIPLKDVTFVRKARTAGLFPNAIEITAWGKKHFFASFLSRDEAYRLLIEGWSHHSGYAKLFLESEISPCTSPDAHILDRSASSSEPFNYSSMAGQSESNCDRQVDDACLPTTAKEQLEDDNVARDKYLERESYIGCSHVAQNLGIWQLESGSAPPLPENFKTVLECEFPIDEEEFFKLFFSNDATDFVEMFHRKCGDEDFNCTQWIKHHHFGHIRDISFRHPINLYFGPKASYCHEVQRFKVYLNRHVVIETSQQLTDVPYGDYFHVEVRWDVKRLLTRPTPFCSICISLDVAFSKKTVWKNKIVQGTFDESKEAYSTWIREALALLDEIGVLHRKDQILKADLESLETAEIQALPSTVICTSEIVSASIENATVENSATFDGDVQQFQMPRHSQPLVLKSEGMATKISRAPTPETTYIRKHVGLGGKCRTKSIQEEPKAACSTRENSRSTSPNLFSSRANQNTGPNDLLKVLVLVFAVFILMLQIGIMVILARAPTSLSSHIGNDGKLVQSGAQNCLGGSYGQEELKWLEQRAYAVKEQIMKSENRLESLQHDITSLKMRFQIFEQIYPLINVNQQNFSFNNNPK
ncbi:hypothetical protein O6H91_06G052100 [Diphasiastrum complanatum]|uniref:Uncharacterized protein n=1 Tax=Diphasiastrum complanatum TaxID=34168 RepID=A0ACC2DDQ1_DIPCM|nr:hypothetical protein O6H91_06G052100 [Diphasiastrum complanatum]